MTGAGQTVRQGAAQARRTARSDGAGSVPVDRSTFAQFRPLMILLFCHSGRSNARELVRETPSDALDTTAAPSTPGT